MDKVSVIIPTFNRFKYLLNAIKSVKEQTYANIELIVVNDGSTEKDYYEYDWKENNIIIIHLEKNSKEIFNYPCVGFVRNKGIEMSSGKYIAFCDDDDIWFPKKIDIQLKAMKETGCKMSSTDGLIGKGIYDSTKKYVKYNADFYYYTLQKVYSRKGSNLFMNGFPDVWNLEFIQINNCIVCSSVLMDKEILDKIGGMGCKRRGQDYDCWLQSLQLTNCVYVKDVCFYYDYDHGDGKNH
jgi:glycosyltransferase involved in cell wall biosynthesis|uniref:Glycosyltransferase 2-like domain-containing protein n=1 Tax=viral metagenome TaxID=1070528 RepID=A0A6C0D945_9ZZZZ